MSTERIEYHIAPLSLRIVAILIDIVLIIILAVVTQFGFQLEYDIFWNGVLGLELNLQEVFWYVLWFIIEFPLYLWLVSSLTEGQTFGKMLTGIHVITDDNKSTKRKWMLHLKRTFQMRSGTKVVKQEDPGVKGL